jgi:deoxyribodipyrimidine photo-lyase
MQMTIEQLRNSPRVTVRRDGPPNSAGRCVVYWMQRAQRAEDNPALDVAVAAGNELGLPVVVFVGIDPSYPRANLRHLTFLADNFGELDAALAARNVGFVLRRGPDHSIARACAELGAALVIGDESPLRELEAWRKNAAEELKAPLWTVDADVIVPTRLLGREQFSARIIRPKLMARLAEHLVRSTEDKARVAWQPPADLQRLDPRGDVLDGFPTDRSVSTVKLRGGTTAGKAALAEFIEHRLDGYSLARAQPEDLGTSMLSPYLHFGHIGPRMVALAVRDAAAPDDDKRAFLEQLIVRRELAVNFVTYNRDYDRLNGCEPWARYTLHRHLRDRRPRASTLAQLDAGESPDPLWNAAQKEARIAGWMHGYMRMYWAKKLLEFCATPDDAFETAVALNDRYQLDGRDPNGYAGIAWSLGGKHDRAWGPERPIFGKVRYMSLASTSRKFDAKAYIARIAALAKTG